jgi:HEAT repeat protein
VLDRVRAGALADAGQRHFALVAVERRGADLDEFVRRDGALDLGDDGVGQAFFTQLQDWMKVVGAGL